MSVLVGHGDPAQQLTARCEHQRHLKDSGVDPALVEGVQMVDILEHVNAGHVAAIPPARQCTLSGNTFDTTRHGAGKPELELRGSLQPLGTYPRRASGLLFMVTMLSAQATGVSTCVPSQFGIHKHLSSPHTMLQTLEELYSAYGVELRALHRRMKDWCRITQSCKFCDVEAEMLYMLIRKWRPNHVFEMAPNRGYSSHFILSALSVNDHGQLDSFDIHRAARKYMDPALARRWNFTIMDVRAAVPTAHVGARFMAKYDFVFIDALHTTDFSSWYTRSLLNYPVRCDTPVIIHDIVADMDGGGRESMPVFQYMAFAPDVRHTFTMHPRHAPSLLSHLDNSSVIDMLRSKFGINGYQKYFECNASPSIFFMRQTTRGRRRQAPAA